MTIDESDKLRNVYFALGEWCRRAEELTEHTDIFSVDMPMMDDQLRCIYYSLELVIENMEVDK